MNCGFCRLLTMPIISILNGIILTAVKGNDEKREKDMKRIPSEIEAGPCY